MSPRLARPGEGATQAAPVALSGQSIADSKEATDFELREAFHHDGAKRHLRKRLEGEAETLERVRETLGSTQLPAAAAQVVSAVSVMLAVAATAAAVAADPAAVATAPPLQHLYAQIGAFADVCGASSHVLVVPVANAATRVFPSPWTQASPARMPATMTHRRNAALTEGLQL